MFDLVRRTPLEEYDGEGLFYVHAGTGMEVFHIRTSNGSYEGSKPGVNHEMVANFMFSTPSQDDKGVAHILEHTVLCGSKRFPVKDPFSLVLQSSPNTFLNAVTFCDKTMFPLASPLKKDFDNLFDIYADAVFAPLLRLESFQQEGVRCFDGKYDGVVFNEMCGARSTEDSIVQTYSTKFLYEGTPCQYDSGGDPISIVDLGYDEYRERYLKWYSPSNCRLFLFGDFDSKEYLDKLESRYLVGASKGSKFIPKSEYYEQKHIKPFRKHIGCAVKDASSVVLTWLTTPSSDPLEVLTVSVLVDVLLGNPGAPLYKAIVESGLGEDLNPMCGTDPDSPMLTFTIGFSKALKGREDEIEAFLLSEVERLAKDGLPKDAVAAAIKRQEFKLQEIPGDGLPFGVSTSLKAARSWLRGGSPENGVKDFKRLEDFKARMAGGRYLEDWMLCNLVENPRRCLLTVEEDPSSEERFKAALEEKLARLGKLGLLSGSDEKAHYEAFIDTPDSPEAIATIGRISRDDLPLDIPEYRTQSVRTPGGARLYVLPLFTRSIVYISMGFDVRGLNLEDKKLLPLLVRFLNMCGTKGRSYSQVGTCIKHNTGGFAINTTAGRDVKGRPISLVVVKAKALREDLPMALDIIGDILLEADFSDHSRIKAALTDLLTDFESGYTYSGNSYAVLSASSTFSPSALESELMLGTSCWMHMRSIKERLEKDGGDPAFERTLSDRLAKLCSKVFVQRGLKFHLGREEPSEECKQLVLKHIDRYPVGKFVRISDYYRKDALDMALYTARKRVFQVSSGPAFNAFVTKFVRRTDKDLVGAMLLAWTMESGCLWDGIRGRNGAYGVESHVDDMEDLLVFSSYRDPCVERTFEEFKKALGCGLDPQDVEYGVVSMVGREMKAPTPQMKCAQSFRRIVYGLTPALHRRRRAILLSLTAKDLEDLAGRILCEMHGGTSCVRVTVCGEDMADDAVGNAEDMDFVSLPV